MQGNFPRICPVQQVCTNANQQRTLECAYHWILDVVLSGYYATLSSWKVIWAPCNIPPSPRAQLKVTKCFLGG